MILKFISRPMDEISKYSERFVDCIDFIQIYSNDGNEIVFQTVSENSTIKQVFRFACEFTDIYVLNDNGKTVDSFKFRTIDNVTKRV